MLIIPAIDLKQGQCVRLRQGDMEQSTTFSNDPVTIADQWIAQGARRLHIVDLDGAFEGKPVNLAVIEAIAAKHKAIPIQVGGGIRDLDTAEKYFNAGVEYIIIGTQAVYNPNLVMQLCQLYPDQIIIGLDARDGLVATDGWAQQSNISVLTLAQQFEKHDVAAIIYTDIARDGMMQGVNIDATCRLAEATTIPVIASGGIHNLDDIRALKSRATPGIIGAITGRAIYEGSINLTEAQTLADSNN